MESPLSRYGATYGTRFIVLLVSFYIFGLIALLAYSFYFFVRELRGARAVADIATSRIASAAQGYTEITGRGLLSDCIKAPLSNRDCLWYSFQQFEEKGSGKRRFRTERSVFWKILYLFFDNDSDDKLVDSGKSKNLFVIIDGTARCYVDPEKAQMSDLDYRIWFEGDFRCQELLLLPRKDVYVLGNFSTESPAQVNSKLRRAVGERIAEWKKDMRTLHRRFDLNQDGIISDQEMQLIRAQALRELKNEDQEIDTPINIIRAPEDGRPFIISHHARDKLVRRYQWHSVFYLVMFIAVTSFLANKPLYTLFAGGMVSGAVHQQYEEWQQSKG